MRRVAAMLFAFAHGCGKIPFVAALLLLLCARLKPVLNAPEEPVRPVVTLPSDYATIDAVLARRAPELGMVLRSQLAVAIADEATRAGFDPLLILAVIDVESDFEEGAVSAKGARGLMQIKPSTLTYVAQKEGIRLSAEEVSADPALCVRLGIRYLASLHDRFGNLDLALMAYNAGPRRIGVSLRENDLDRFRRYPDLVKRDFRRFRQGQGLEGDWALARRDRLSAH